VRGRDRIRGIHEAGDKDGVSEAVKVTASRVEPIFLYMVVIQSNVGKWSPIHIRKRYVAIHFAAHRPSIRACHEDIGIWNFAFRTLLRTLVRSEASIDLGTRGAL